MVLQFKFLSLAFKAILHLGLLTHARTASPARSGGLQLLWFHLNPPLPSLSFSSLSSRSIPGSVLFWGLSHSFPCLEDSWWFPPPAFHHPVNTYLFFRSYLRAAWILQIWLGRRCSKQGFLIKAGEGGRLLSCPSHVPWYWAVPAWRKRFLCVNHKNPPSICYTVCPLCASSWRGHLLICLPGGDGFFQFAQRHYRWPCKSSCFTFASGLLIHSPDQSIVTASYVQSGSGGLPTRQ